MTTKNQFLILHGIAVVLHFSCFLYSILAASGYETPNKVKVDTMLYNNLSISMPYFEKDDTFEFNFPSVTFIHGIVAIITVLFHCIIYIPIHYWYADIVWKQGYLQARWVEYGITCTLMTVSSVVSSGMKDFITLISIFIGGFALQLVGCVIEQTKYNWKVLLAIGVLIESSLGWHVVWYSISSSGITESQWIETIAYVFYYSLFPLNCILDASYRKGSFQITDWYYNLLSLTSKLALFWLQVGEVEQNIYNSAWSYVQIYVLGIVLPLIILAIGIYLRPACTTFLPTTNEDESVSFYKYVAKSRITKQPPTQIVYIKQKSRMRN